MTDKDGDDTGFGEAATGIRNAVHGMKWAIWHTLLGVQQWVADRSRLTHLFIGASIAWVMNQVLPEVGDVTGIFRFLSNISLLSTNQLLLIAMGFVASQTYIQSRALYQMRSTLVEMNQNPTRTDGGEDLPSRDDGTKFESMGTSGGGALGGAFAGAVVGSSYGPGGVVGGAIIGAVLGDAFEESAIGANNRDE